MSEDDASRDGTNGDSTNGDNANEDDASGTNGTGADADADSESETEWEAVFWDIGGVILDIESVQAAHRGFVADLVDRHDAETTVDEAVETWRAAVGAHFRERDGTTFRSAMDGYVKGVEAVLGEPIADEEWRPSFHDNLSETIRPVPGAIEAIEELAERDLHVGVISDVDADEGRRILEGFGVLDEFDSITTSEEVGRTKPDPAMFETALRAAEVDPTRSLMIGDRYEHDVAGADAVGMHGVAFGAEDGPAVAYRIDSPLEVLAIVDGDRTAGDR